MIAVRSLAGASWEQLAAAFGEAFSDYAVPMTLTARQIEDMQRRRGYDAAGSFGAYDGDRLVGFVLTCRDGEVAYNSGTGVVPSHRRGGVARALLDAVIASVRPRRYVLEVLETNTKAIACYRSAGFEETRRLECWTYRGGDRDALPELAAPDLAAIAAHADVVPGWQNSLASLARAIEPYVVIGDERGAAVVFPASGDLPLLAVSRDHRRRGLGKRLLAAAAARAGR
ncbi:MAG: GNAT family N-acetyltransferase, partial [Acidobacteriota bacterium]